MHVETGFEASERYAFDLDKCPASKGWAQVDTKQDASYFGTWANPIERKIVCYCEGDVTITHCDNDAEFVEAINELKAWNVERGYWLGIDPGWPGSESCERITARFAELGLSELLH